ncbi:L-asparaginase [Biomphalaria glabrata]|uniref:Uncharacterized protein LOC106058798 n=1 Tax=Biomphalaria glabrata TaxID=6526 RepID=A0A2C9LSG5_BIOGL|nr:uncharacterized protein LOC106058798 [Biomphalaria glabrata]KAI8746816.1 putative L-asparaginase 2 isoform X1 [Biomphalaria glabrata]KAI8788507.1 L-asparaginase 2 isoform X1 [Biomphalaria glabrata]
MSIHGQGDILIIQTGGTIDKLYPQHPGAYGFEIGPPAVINILPRAAPYLSCTVESICSKDSQEITDADREDILRCVVDANQQLVLITHGTDTICETARYLARAGVGQGKDFGPGVGEKIVVLTGAVKPECMKDSDADFNIGFALGVLQASTSPGVYVAMEGSIVSGMHVVRNKDGKFLDEREM